MVSATSCHILTIHNVAECIIAFIDIYTHNCFTCCRKDKPASDCKDTKNCPNQQIYPYFSCIYHKKMLILRRIYKFHINEDKQEPYNMHYGRSGKPRYHSVFHRHDGRGQKKSTTKDINWSFRMSSTCRTGHIRTIRNGKDAAAIQAAGQDCIC